MARRKLILPEYGTVTSKGVLYYRTRVSDADGKRFALYARTPEELYAKVQEANQQIQECIFRRKTPTVADYCEKWLKIQAARLQYTTMLDYRSMVNKYIVAPLGDRFMAEVTADDVKLALIPVAQLSASVYRTVVTLYKNIFSAAVESNVLISSPCTKISVKGGRPQKKRESLSDEQVDKLLAAIEGLPPYVFVMIGLYAGLRREEILALKWDCVFLDGKAPYLTVQRAWHCEHNRPVISDQLKTPAARRNIPLPSNLKNCLIEAKAKSTSDYVIANKEGNPLSYSQFKCLWDFIVIRTVKERTYTRYCNGEKIVHTVTPVLGEKAFHNNHVVYSLDFSVTPHQLRHTYITNLIAASVDPKTVQYLAGHENSKMTMDVYAQVKYNKPHELLGVVERAFAPQSQKACFPAFPG